MPGSTRARGQQNEDRAAGYLSSRGMEILARNVTAAGAEIDLIGRVPGTAGRPDTVVFVEVRSRTRVEAGDPVETVGLFKRRRLVRAASQWLAQQGLWERVAVRFDVVGIVAADDEKTPRIRWIPGAFDTDEC